MNFVKSRSLTSFLVFVIVVIILSACGSESGSESESKTSTDSQTDVTRVSLATAGTGGAWYPIGGGMANIVNEKSNGVEMSAEVTDGGIENIRLVSEGVNEFAFANTDVVYEGYNGLNTFEAEGEKNILGMFYLYPSTFQVVVMADSGINSIDDLKGKRVAVGPPASSSEVMGWIVLNEYGISRNDITGQTISFEEGATALRDGNVDALFVMSAHPNSQVMDLAATHDIKLLSVDNNVRSKLTEEYEYYGDTIIEAGVYEDQFEDVYTLSLGTTIVANSDVSEEVAYEFTKSIFENLSEVRQFHDVAKQITLENAPNMPIPLHPGAKKYFEEKGMEVGE